MYQNKTNELIYFDERYCGNSFFHVSMIGRTMPNPDYAVSHSPSSTIWKSYNFEYVIAGKGYIETKDETLEVKAGDLYFLNKQQVHYYYSDKTAPFEKIFIVCEGAFVDNLIKTYNVVESVRITHTNARPLFDEIFTRINALQTHTIDPDTNIDIAALVLKLAHKICPPEFYTSTISTRKPSEVLKEYIDSNLYRRITLKELSEVMHLSVSQIGRIFKEEYGTPPHQYIVEKKMDEAKELFQTTNLSVSEVSDKLCFPDLKYFTKTFKLKFGITPSAFLKSQK